MTGKKKIDKARQMSYDSLPPSAKENLTEQAKELSHTAEEWRDSLFEKLDEFIVKE